MNLATIAKLNHRAVYARYQHLCTLDNLALLVNGKAKYHKWGPRTNVTTTLGMTIAVINDSFGPIICRQGYPC